MSDTRISSSCRLPMWGNTSVSIYRHIRAAWLGVHLCTLCHSFATAAKVFRATSCACCFSACFCASGLVSCAIWVLAVSAIARASLKETWGVFSNGQYLLFAVKAEFQPERFCAFGGNVEIQPAAVGQLIGLLLRLGVSDLSVVECYLGVFFRGSFTIPPKIPPFFG